MKRTLFLLAIMLTSVLSVMADVLLSSTTKPSEGKPEHLFTIVNANGLGLNANTSPTRDEGNYALFAFYSVEGVDNAYYIYNYTASKWLNYTKAAGYDNKTDFVTLGANCVESVYWNASNTNNGMWQFRPYNTTGVAGKYMNFYGGVSNYPMDGTKTIGLWQQDGNTDAGSRWTINEVDVEEYTYIVQCDNDVVVNIGGKTLRNGDSYSTLGLLSPSNVTAIVSAGKFAIVKVDNDSWAINISVLSAPEQPSTVPYTNAVLYPQQQEEVGEAKSLENNDTYTLYNNVLAASYIKVGESLFFGGSEAMDLQAGTEPFTVSFGSGTTVAASQMKLKNIGLQTIAGDANAVGGAEHYNGQALVANYEYTYGEGTVKIEWKAVLRDGSHYLRTEMMLEGDGDVDMYNVIPMIYNVDTKIAGSTPAPIGNTRGAVLLSDKIFAGLENPVAYNTVGGAMGEEDKYDLTETLAQKSLNAASWTMVEEGGVPNRVTEATGYGYPNIYEYQIPNVSLKADQKVEVTITYTSGNHRLNFAGVDLLDAEGDAVANDYHSGYSGHAKQNNVFTFVAPYDGTFTMRCMIENASEAIDASSNISTNIYTPKEGVIINEDLVGIEGRWSRNTTLLDGETWKISSVVGLVAQDGQQANPDIRKTQKRRSFLAYSERERAVPWRANPAYVCWYELQINRNNAPDPTNNTNEEQLLNVLNHWKTSFYDKYGLAPKSFVIDDGWDNYGTWTFHAKFPDELRNVANLAEQMGAGVGAWLGPVGGYGQSGNYRRKYWTDQGQSMVLSNPNYYETFLNAAKNLTQNQGDFNFFKFDGISGQFSSVGPDAGDTGNENAEGIIRLERYVRENLKRDIFFNTTVGTWASPFWYHYTDATWRQENDYGVAGDNTIDRENWITYRDRLVYQNYVQNSPLCPINTLMTHGFILSKFGNVSKNMTYAAVKRELRCAFACGSGMVELYNDYELMDNINNGKLWADLADCINWQRKNADVLMDAHWVGGNPWNGSVASIYGWASWNGQKATFTLRNGANNPQSITLTLREALEIPANMHGSIVLTKAFADQPALNAISNGLPIDIDQELIITLPASSVYIFDGMNADTDPVAVNDVLSENQAEGQSLTDSEVTKSNRCYDLQGRPVAKMRKGEYYVAGGKLIKN